MHLLLQDNNVLVRRVPRGVPPGTLSPGSQPNLGGPVPVQPDHFRVGGIPPFTRAQMRRAKKREKSLEFFPWSLQSYLPAEGANRGHEGDLPDNCRALISKARINVKRLDSGGWETYNHADDPRRQAAGP